MLAQRDLHARSGPWSAEDRAELRRLIIAGVSIPDISAALNRPEGAVRNRVSADNLNFADPDVRDGYLRCHWTRMTAANLASNMHLRMAVVLEHGRRLGLDPADMPRVSETIPKPRKGSQKARMVWAYESRKTDREAALVWDHYRVTQGLPPLSRGYA